MTLRAALYARYSTDNQSSRSVDDQLALCAAFAARAGHVVVQRYADAAVSGQMLAQRSGFSALMQDLRASPRPFDVLVVEHADRLTRHPGDIHMIREAFAFAGVPVLQVDGGELDAMKASVSGLVSSLTLQSVIEKTRRGMAARAADGLRMGGRLYGYAPVKGEPGRMVIDPAQAEVVRRIFALYIGGLSARSIALRLNAEGLAAPRGALWSASAIGGWGQRGNGIIGNEAYCGIVIWGKVRMLRDPVSRKRISRPVPPADWQRVARPELAIIAPETFAAAQARRQGRRAITHAIRPRHLLSGLLRCPCCGGGMSIKDGRGEARRIICTRRAETGACHARQTYRLSRIESAVVAALRAEIDQPEGLALYARTYNAERRRLAQAEQGNRAAQQRDLTGVVADLDRAISAVIKGTMGHAAAQPHIARLEARKAVLEAQLRASPPPAVVTLHGNAVARLRGQLDDLVEVLAQATAAGDTGPAAAFREVVTHVTVMPGYEIEITGNLSPLTLGGTMVAGEGCERFPPHGPAIPFIIRAAA